MIPVMPDQIPHPDQLVRVTLETCALDADARRARVRETDLSMAAFGLLIHLMDVDLVSAESPVRVGDYMDNDADLDEITPVRFAELVVAGFMELL